MKNLILTLTISMVTLLSFGQLNTVITGFNFSTWDVVFSETTGGSLAANNNSNISSGAIGQNKNINITMTKNFSPLNTYSGNIELDVIFDLHSGAIDATLDTVILLASIDNLNWETISTNITYDFSDTLKFDFINTNKYKFLKMDMDFNTHASYGVAMNGVKYTLKAEGFSNIKDISTDFNVVTFKKTLNIKSYNFTHYQLNIFNLNGQKVFSQQSNGDLNIPLDLSGIYIVNIETENGNLAKKVIF